MAEKVETGGLMSFRYEKGSHGKLEDKEKREIEGAYARAEERKMRERRNRMIMWIVIIAVLLLVVWGIWFFLR
tara:strand:+ start:1811 stop:2029 length:219 start_codon:yes stop_codon:yes gene_type:complete